MDGSVASGLGSAIFFVIIVAVLIVSGLWLGIGYFVGKSKYDSGYLQGQLDYRNGIIKIKTDTTTAYRLSK